MGCRPTSCFLWTPPTKNDKIWWCCISNALLTCNTSMSLKFVSWITQELVDNFQELVYPLELWWPWSSPCRLLLILKCAYAIINAGSLVMVSDVDNMDVNNVPVSHEFISFVVNICYYQHCRHQIGYINQLPLMTVVVVTYCSLILANWSQSGVIYCVCFSVVKYATETWPF
jgi:hypothetical protein